MKLRYLFWIFFIVSTASADGLDACAEHIKYGVPSHHPVLLCRLGYAESFNTDRKVADWVAYHLTREKAEGSIAERSNNFHADPDLPSGQRSELADYAKSGYDRGHLAPAGDMKWNEQAMSQSFLLSNMAPQVGIGFNRGIWKNLEERVRTFAVDRGELYVFTGPLYIGEHITTIGPNYVAVPTHFYKIVFDPVRIEAIAFILPNMKLSSANMDSYITSVDTVESLTRLDFLSELDDTVEAVVEAKLQLKMW